MEILIQLFLGVLFPNGFFARFHQSRWQRGISMVGLILFGVLFVVLMFVFAPSGSSTDTNRNRDCDIDPWWACDEYVGLQKYRKGESIQLNTVDNCSWENFFTKCAWLKRDIEEQSWFIELIGNVFLAGMCASMPSLLIMGFLTLFSPKYSHRMRRDRLGKKTRKFVELRFASSVSLEESVNLLHSMNDEQCKVAVTQHNPNEFAFKMKDTGIGHIYGTLHRWNHDETKVEANRAFSSAYTQEELKDHDNLLDKLVAVFKSAGHVEVIL